MPELTKYPTAIYEDVRQNLDYEEDDPTPDAEIDEMDRADVLNRVLVWNCIGDYGYEVRELVYAIYGIDLDAEVGEASRSVVDTVPAPKEGKVYPDFVYKNVRQRHDYDELDDADDAYIDEMNKSEVLNDYVSWDGFIDGGADLITYINDIYEVDLYKAAGEQTPWYW